MTAIQEKIMNVEEYIQYELRSERRHEFINGQLFEMPGEKDINNEIANLLTALFFSILRQKGYSVYSHDVKIAIPDENKFYYPDWFITSEPKSQDNQYIKYQPELIVEVISKSSRINDTVNKFIDYTKISSLKYYLLIEPESVYITVYSKDESGEWQADIYTSKEDIISLSIFNLQIPLKEIYA